MLKQIDLFQKEAKKFRLDSNSVTAFETWAEFKSATKTAGRKGDSVKEFNLFIEAKKKADAASDYISKKVEHLMKEEGKTQDQALGQAYGMARQEGYDVPAPPKSSSKKVAEPEEMEEMEEHDHEEEGGEGMLGDEAPGEGMLDEGSEDIEELAHEMFAKWESGEMSLKDMHHEFLEQLGDSEKEEEAEDIIFGLVDEMVKELTGEEEGEKEVETEPEGE